MTVNIIQKPAFYGWLQRQPPPTSRTLDCIDYNSFETILQIVKWLWKQFVTFSNLVTSYDFLENQAIDAFGWYWKQDGGFQKTLFCPLEFWDLTSHRVPPAGHNQRLVSRNPLHTQGRRNILGECEYFSYARRYSVVMCRVFILSMLGSVQTVM